MPSQVPSQVDTERSKSSFYRELMKHSAVYWIGHVLSRVASILLLPLYTSYLTPADYGNMSILELTQAMLEVFALGGISVAALRFGADPAYEKLKHGLWTTGLCMLTVISIPQLLTAWLLREQLASLTLGPEVADGGFYYSLAICTLGLNLFVGYSNTYLRVLKKSVLFVSITISILLLRIFLNVWTIAFLHLGILGFLYSGLIASACQSVAFAVILFLGRPFKVHPELFKKLWAYGWPFIVTSLASTILHQGDRYLLRWILNDMSQVGIYSLAYSIVQGVNAFVIQPFNQIWAPMVFEVHYMPDREAVYARIYKYFALGLFLVLSGVAVFSEPIIRILSNENYIGAAELMPILCLGFFLFSLHGFFCLPAQIHKRTFMIAAISVSSAVVRLVAGAALILGLGLKGAALSGLVAYGVYSLGGHLRYRKIENLKFPLSVVAYCAVAGVLVTYASRLFLPADSSVEIEILWGAILWTGCAGLTLMGPARPLLAQAATLKSALRRRLKPEGPN